MPVKTSILRKFHDFPFDNHFTKLFVMIFGHPEHVSVEKQYAVNQMRYGTEKCSFGCPYRFLVVLNDRTTMKLETCSGGLNSPLSLCPRNS